MYYALFWIIWWKFKAVLAVGWQVHDETGIGIVRFKRVASLRANGTLASASPAQHAKVQCRGTDRVQTRPNVEEIQ